MRQLCAACLSLRPCMYTFPKSSWLFGSFLQAPCVGFCSSIHHYSILFLFSFGKAEMKVSAWASASDVSRRAMKQPLQEVVFCAETADLC